MEGEVGVAVATVIIRGKTRLILLLPDEEVLRTHMMQMIARTDKNTSTEPITAPMIVPIELEEPDEPVHIITYTVRTPTEDNKWLQRICSVLNPLWVLGVSTLLI
jgi:hypothetical protein